MRAIIKTHAGITIGNCVAVNGNIRRIINFHSRIAVADHIIARYRNGIGRFVIYEYARGVVA